MVKSHREGVKEREVKVLIGFSLWILRQENVEVLVESENRVQRVGPANGVVYGVSGAMQLAEGEGVEPGVRSGGEAREGRARAADNGDIR